MRAPLAGRAHAGGGQISVADLAGLELIVPPAGRPHRRSLERALLEVGIPWQPAAEADGWDLLVHLASLGLGATVVNGCVPPPDGMTAIPVSGLPAVRYWAAWRAARGQRRRVPRAFQRRRGRGVSGELSAAEVTAASKFLAYVLRHDPAAIGLALDDGGWVAIDVLLAAAARNGRALSADALRQVIDAPGKRRFEARDGLIRAAQGHSVPVSLGLEPLVPPGVLFHGTVARFLPAILAEGLRPGQRVHVHLSADPGTAAAVGARRGRPVILQVDAAGMHEEGHEFFRAANGVWLTARVPPGYVSAGPAPGAGMAGHRRPPHAG